MNELMRIKNNGGRQTVSGRDLHEFLEVDSNYTTWFERMTEYGFSEGIDYSVVFQKRNTTDNTAFGGNRVIASIDHQITLSMAKEISMIQR